MGEVGGEVMVWLGVRADASNGEKASGTLSEAWKGSEECAV